MRLMDEKPGALLTSQESATYLKIPKSTSYRLFREAKIPSQQIGRFSRFRKGGIDPWLVETHVSAHGSEGNR